MAEVGLVPFARVALGVATAVVPPFRHPRSKHVFTQPQLLAIRCLMRYEDWTFREAEGRLAEHRELRRACGSGACPTTRRCVAFWPGSIRPTSRGRWPRSAGGCHPAPGRPAAAGAARSWR